MTYNEFKNHFYKRLIDEFGFKNEDKIYRYRNDEVIAVFSIEKSSYSNSVSFFGVGITPLDVINNWNKPEPKIAYYSSIILPLEMKDYIELDELKNYEEYDKIFDCFFENIFPKLLTKQSLKDMIKSGKLDAKDYLKEYWNIK